MAPASGDEALAARPVSHSAERSKAEPYYLAILVNLLGPIRTVAAASRIGAPVRKRLERLRDKGIEP